MVVEFDALWHRFQAFLDFVDRHRAKVPAVDADIERLRIAGQSVVRMPIQLQRAPMRAVPGAQGVVAQYDLGLADLDLFQLADTLPSGGFFDPVRMVVIAEDQVFLFVEQFEIGGMVIEGEITQVIDQVLRRDPFVPAFDNGASIAATDLNGRFVEMMMFL